MNNHAIVFTLFLALTLSACGNQGGNQQAAQSEATPADEQLWDELMAVHDDVMPKIGDMRRISKQLEDMQESGENLSAEMQERINLALQKLSDAEETMMDWMRNLKQLEPLRDSMDEQGVMDYLNAEKEKINQVRDAMLGSLEEGLALLNDIQGQ
jgi:hypothetical protein